MKRLTKIVLFVMCLTTAFLVSVVIANGQETPVKISVSVKNILKADVSARPSPSDVQ